MPISFTYDHQLKILFTTAKGPLSFAELLAHLDEEASAKALQYRELVDASDASTTLTSDEANSKMRNSLPRVDTDGIRLY